MCSIYGNVFSSGQDGPQRQVAERMGLATRHRGPDDAGVHRAPGILLGLQRLAVIDVAGGHQPISNEDDTVWTVCNGEIYNFQELRKQLAGCGHVFRTASDSEVVVHAYEEYGDAFVERLSGMFALAVWDSRERRLLLARDRVGIKPLYYMEEPGRLIFASEAKAILAAPGVTAGIDTTALREFLALGYSPAPLCLFAGMRKLQPGCVMEVREGRTTLRRYWTPGAQEQPAWTEESWVEAVRAEVERAVVRQMVSDVPVGAFLSGGLDSSSVVAFMARNSTSPVRTYAVGFEDRPAGRFYDERPYARLVAERFGTEHHEVVVGPGLARRLPQLVWHLDEPLADSAFATTYPIASLAGHDVKVALSGIGGDELFGGYARYLSEYFDRLYRLIPTPVRQHVLGPLTRRLPVDRGSRLGNLSRMLRHFIFSEDQPFEERYRTAVGVFTDQNVADMCLLDDGRADILGRALARSEGDALQRLLQVDMETQLPDDLLFLTDKMTMAASVECRVPLLDDRLIDLAARMPSHLKVRGRRTKYVLGRAMQGILPPEILGREKRGFGAPFGTWLRRELAPLRDHLLSPQAVQRRGLLRPHVVAQLIAQHQNASEDHTDHLTALMTLELWCRIYLDKRDPEDVAAELPT